MRMTHIFSALLVATTLGTTALVTAPTTAHAKAKTTLKTFPKSIRGTWYHYEENNGYYYKSMAISSKKLTVKNYMDIFAKKQSKWTGTLHTTKNQNDVWQYGGKKSHWTSAKAVKGGYTKIVSYGMFATNGSGTYKVVHQNYKGKSVKVLYNKHIVNSSGSKKLADHYYKTKAQAKYFNPVGALHK
ncbi:hypothetical protein [Levilactobacillus humaensis]|uniref:hypothetical protein n=1 Tax=Levilactobacillus humaensis TaxID=2950375 RepID=UPI0021C286C6|nr:hypothetical protein [Levilactobacillus humaensis]